MSSLIDEDCVSALGVSSRAIYDCHIECFTRHELRNEGRSLYVSRLYNQYGEVQFCYDADDDVRIIVHNYNFHYGEYMTNVVYAVVGSTVDNIILNILGHRWFSAYNYNHMLQLLNFMNNNFHLCADTIEHYDSNAIHPTGIHALLDMINIYHDIDPDDRVEGVWWEPDNTCEYYEHYECAHLFCGVAYIKICYNYGMMSASRVKSARK